MKAVLTSWCTSFGVTPQGKLTNQALTSRLVNFIEFMGNEATSYLLDKMLSVMANLQNDKVIYFDQDMYTSNYLRDKYRFFRQENFIKGNDDFEALADAADLMEQLVPPAEGGPPTSSASSMSNYVPSSRGTGLPMRVEGTTLNSIMSNFGAPLGDVDSTD